MKTNNLRTTASRAKTVFPALLALWMATTLGSLAATLRWTGGHATSSEWSRPANWDLGVAPQDGDTLVFPGGASRLINVNNIADLDLSAIRFSGISGGYVLGGNGVTVTNSITATNSAGVNTINLNRIILAKELPFNAAQPGAVLVVNSDVRLNGNNLLIAGTGELQLLGVIQGNGDLIKSNSGSLVLGGAAANTYTGDTLVEEGTVHLEKTAGLAVPGMLIIGDGVGGSGADVVRHGGDNQVNKVTVQGSGLWDLGNFEEEVSELHLNAGGDVTTGVTGHLKLGVNADVTVTASLAPFPDASRISGNLDLLLGNHTFHVTEGLPGASDATDLIIDAHINGLGALTKTGRGDLSLSGNNTFIGLVKVEEGELRIDSSMALGQTLSGTQILNTGSLQLRNNITVHDELLTLNSTGTTGLFNDRPALQSAGNNVWDGDIQLEQNSRMGVNGGGSLEISGVIRGSFGITKEDTGTLQFSGANPNTFSGDMTVTAGTLELDKGTIGGTAVAGRLIIGDGLGGPGADIVKHLKSNQTGNIIVNGSGLWNLNDREEEVQYLELNEGGDVQTGTTGLLTLGIGADVVVTPSTSQPRDVSRISGKMTLLLGAHSFTLTEGDAPTEVLDNAELVISADIEGIGAITQKGDGDMVLAGANSFAGLVTVEGGELRVEHPMALGDSLSGTRIENNAVLRLSGTGGILNESLRLNSPGETGPDGKPTLIAEGTNGWTGLVELVANARIGVLGGAELNITGPITGSGGITKQGEGQLNYLGGTINSYSGTTRVLEGILNLGRPPISGSAIRGNLIVGTDASTASPAVVRCLFPNQVWNQAAVTVAASGSWFPWSEHIGSLEGAGTVSTMIQLSLGLNHADTTFSGSLQGNANVFKLGTGTFHLTGTNTLTGSFLITEGRLALDGTLDSANVFVSNGGHLSGSGSTRNILLLPNSTLEPGSSPGIMSSHDFSMLPNATLRMELNGNTPGTEHDQVDVRATVALGGATLDVRLGYVPTVGQQWILIRNSGNDPVVDTFSGLPEGAILRLNNLPFEISYQGGDGNDVVLTYNDSALSVEEVVVNTSSANGNGLIERNECNALSIELRNERNLPLLIKGAVLDSLTPGVLVTQQESAYLPFEPLGSRSNVLPFTLSTTPDFECGRTIRLQLTVTIPGFTSFALPVLLPSGSPGTPVRYDQPANLNITDNGQTISTLEITNAPSYLGKVAVGLHIRHDAAGDLVLRLRSPQGTTVRLATQIGGALNDFGTQCNPITDRTVFDDEATNKITTAVPPFVGVFVPEDELSKFAGENPNGTWKLLIDDTVAGDTGILECWSLALAAAECSTEGTGDCETCTPVTRGSFNASSPTTTVQLAPSGTPSLCGVTNTCPGTNPAANLKYQVHTFTNLVPRSQCITVHVSADCGRNSGQIRAAAYAGSFDPSNPCLHYLGDSGGSPFGDHEHFSFEMPANQDLVVVVFDMDGLSTCDSYALRIHGPRCPAPELSIRAGAAAGTVVLEWSTAYPGWTLKQSLHAGATDPAEIRTVQEPPTIVNGHYQITLPTTADRSFFWLESP